MNRPLENLLANNRYRVKSLQAAWKMQDGSGSVAVDSSTNAPNSLTLAGDSWESPLAFSRWFNMVSGQNAHAASGTHTNFSNIQTFSVSTWFNTSNVSSEVALLSCLDPSNNYIGWEVNLNGFTNAGSINITLINTYPTNYMLGYVSFSANTWYNLVFTYSGSGDVSGLKAYLNGSPVVLTTGANTLSATSAGTIPVYMGSRNNATDFYAGKIGPTYIWSRVLSAGEVSALYAAPYSPSATNLQAAWSLAGGSLADSSPNAPNSLSFTGTPLIDGMTPLTEWLYFAGAGSATSANATHTNFSNTQPFSVSTWFVSPTTASEMSLVGTLNPSSNYIGWEINLNGFLPTGASSFNLVFIASYPSNYIRGYHVFSANTLYNLVFTYNGSYTFAGVKAYLNGSLITLTNGSSSLTPATIASGLDVLFARRPDATNKYTGTIGATYIWNRVLTSAEVLAVYNNPYNPLS